MSKDFYLASAWDRSLHEARRRNVILEAIGEDWDPVQALAEESRAYQMLYSDLDDEQQRAYDQLVEAGVCPNGVRV